MNKSEDTAVLKCKVNSRLERIANILLLNSSFTDNLGLLNGKMGIAIFFYKYGRYSNNKVYTDYAGELIDEIYEEINTNTSVDFANGLTGIGWGIGYLIENKFVDADSDEALEEIDNAVYRSMLNSPLLIDNVNDLFGCGLYCLSRLKGHEHDDDNLTTLIKKEHLIYLTDECERLLVHKRYLEFNILQLSTATVNSVLWFLLEMERLAIFPSKVKKVLKYLPDYISHGQGEANRHADMFILHEMSKKASEQLTDEALRKQYLLLFSRTEVELRDNIPDDKLLFAASQSKCLQKLVYGPYIDSIQSDSVSFEKAFGLIDDEDEWNKTLDNLNKSILGLTGLAGAGLLLMSVQDLTELQDLEDLHDLQDDFVSKLATS